MHVAKYFSGQLVAAGTGDIAFSAPIYPTIGLATISRGSDYRIARLHRDRPDIHARVRAGFAPAGPRYPGRKIIALRRLRAALDSVQMREDDHLGRVLGPRSVAHVLGLEILRNLNPIIVSFVQMDNAYIQPIINCAASRPGRP